MGDAGAARHLATPVSSLVRALLTHQPVPESSGLGPSRPPPRLFHQRGGASLSPSGKRDPPGLNLGWSQCWEQGSVGMVEPSLFLRVRLRAAARPGAQREQF